MYNNIIKYLKGNCRIMSKKEEYQSIDEKLYPDLLSKASVISNKNVRIRYEQSVKWYIKKANFCKKLFYFLSFLEFFFPGVIVIVNCASDCFSFSPKFYITILSVLSTLAASILALFKFHRKWINYRFVAESLQSEFSLYIGKVGAYDCSDNEKRDKIFITNIEKTMKNDLSNWERIIKSNSNTP